MENCKAALRRATLQFFFYKWLAAKKPAQLNRFIGEQDSL